MTEGKPYPSAKSVVLNPRPIDGPLDTFVPSAKVIPPLWDGQIKCTVAGVQQLRSEIADWSSLRSAYLDGTASSLQTNFPMLFGANQTGMSVSAGSLVLGSPVVYDTANLLPMIPASVATWTETWPVAWPSYLGGRGASFGYAHECAHYLYMPVSEPVVALPVYSYRATPAGLDRDGRKALRFVDSILATLTLILVMVLDALSCRRINAVNFVLLMLAVCRRYGYRHEPGDDDSLPARRHPSLPGRLPTT